jgi:P-type Cu+ transporter
MDLEGEQRRHLRKATLSVEGMHCTACSGSVEAALRSVPGVATASASALNHSAEATFDERQATSRALETALNSAGFPGRVIKEEVLGQATQVLKFRVEGMTCSTCSGAVESAFAATSGVVHASVSLTLQEAKVEYDPELVSEVRRI